MTDVIYKYGPFSDDIVEFAGEPVHVGYQDIGYAHAEYGVFVWTLMSDEPRFGRAKIVATGEEYTGKYVGTVVMPLGLVWHVVEV